LGVWDLGSVIALKNRLQQIRERERKREKKERMNGKKIKAETLTISGE